MKLNRQKYEIARARACISTKELIAAGVPQGTLCHMLSGKDVRPETIGKVARVLKVDVLEIIETEN